MITNKDIRVENGFLIINGDKYPLDGQSPEAIMAIVEDNSDTTPTENSTAPITSGGVFTALGTKQDTLTFDDIPTENSTNPVKSGGVFSKLSEKQNTIHVYEETFNNVDINTPWGAWYVTTALTISYSDLGLTNPPKSLILSVKEQSTTFMIMEISYTKDTVSFYLVRPNSNTVASTTITAAVIL